MIEPETPWDRAAVEQHEEHWSEGSEPMRVIPWVLGAWFIIAAGVGAWVAL